MSKGAMTLFLEKVFTFSHVLADRGGLHYEPPAAAVLVTLALLEES